MTAQPCPSCGTLMIVSRVFGEDPCDEGFFCPMCGSCWTQDEIDIEYALNAEMDKNYPSPDEGIRE